MRLIDANDVKRRGDCYPSDVRKVISNILSHTKTVKDAAVIVRCKDCKYHEDEEPGMVYCPIIVFGWIRDDWFCADAERKTDE